MLRMIYHLPLRQAEGFAGSVLALLGLDLRVTGLLHPLAAARRLGGRTPAAAPTRPHPLGRRLDGAESVWRGASGRCGSTERARGARGASSTLEWMKPPARSSHRR